MKRAALILAALAAILTAAAAPVRTATEGFVANKIAEAVAAIPAPDYSTNNTALVKTIEATAPAPGNYAAVSNAAVHAAITNALQDAAISTLSTNVYTKAEAATKDELDAKLDKTGGTMTGPLVVESIESNVHVGQTDSGAELTIGHLHHAPQLVKINCYGAIHIIDSETGSSRFIVQIPFKSGTLALLSDIPTTMAWSAITGKPTTISGYGITDALKSDFASLTNNAEFTSAVAAVSPPADTSELEARGFVRIVADDEIYFVTITTTQTEE